MPGQIILKSKFFLLGSAAAGAALLAVWGSGGAPSLLPSPGRAPASSASQNGSSEQNFSGSRLYSPEAGQRYTYTFSRKINFEGNLAGVEIPAVAYHGEFYVDVLRADAKAFEAIVSERVKEAGGKISPPFRIEASTRGDSLLLFSSNATDDETREHASVVKDILSLWLFPLRSDTVGSYAARFEKMAPDAAFPREKKIKLSYHAKTANIPSVLTSLHVLRWNETIRLPEAIEGTETTRLGGDSGALSAESTYRLQYRSHQLSPAISHEVLASLRQNLDLTLDPTSTSMAEHPDYKKLDWGKLMTQLRYLDKVSGSEQLAAFGDILKYLRMHPEKTADLAALLRDPALLQLGMRSPVFKTIVGALASAGSPEGLAALREAFADPNLANEGKSTILAALTTTQAPLDVATRDFLANTMQSATDPHLAQGAAFALGSALQSAGNDAQAKSAIQQIKDSWQSQNSVTDRLAILDVMGNSGRAEFYPTLKSVIASNDPAQLRARAVFALRFIDQPAAVQTLAASLGDKDTTVRQAAVGAMGTTWNETYRAPVEQCAQSESEARVQELCRKTLADNPHVADAE